MALGVIKGPVGPDGKAEGAQEGNKENRQNTKEKVQKSLQKVQEDITSFTNRVSLEVLGNKNLVHSSKLEAMKRNGFASGEFNLDSMSAKSAEKMLADLVLLRKEIEKTKDKFDELKEELKNYRARDIGHGKTKNENLSEDDAIKFIGKINKLILKINDPRGETSRLGIAAGKIFSQVGSNLMRYTIEKSKNTNKMNEREAA